MSNDNNKKPNISDDDIEKILSEFSGNKKETEKSAKDIEPPKNLKKPSKHTTKKHEKKSTDHKTNSGKMRAQYIATKNSFLNFKKTKAFKKVLISIGCVILAVIIAVCVYFGVTASKRKMESKYNVEIPKAVASDYYDAYAKNPDLFGHLKIENSDIDFNVYKANDNEFYKYHSEAKASSSDGALYVDKNDKSTSQNTIIYGSKVLIGNVEEMYSSPNEYKNNPVISFDNLEKNQSFVVIGAFYTNTNKKYNNNYVFPYNTADMTDTSLIDFRDNLNARFIYTTSRELKITDKILMICVDSDLFPSAKFVVVAVQSNEKVDTSKVKSNPKPCYPQIWYDINNKENPYKISGKWYPSIYTSDSKQVTTKLSAKDYE